MIPLYALNPANFTLRAIARAAWRFFRGKGSVAPAPQDIRTFSGAFWGCTYTPGEPFHPPETFGDPGSFLSLGTHEVPAGKVETIRYTPEQCFAPSKLFVASTAIGLDILEVSIAGSTVFEQPVPIELFSEVAHLPRFRWPACPAGKSIVIKVAHTGVSEDDESEETGTDDDGENRSA